MHCEFSKVMKAVDEATSGMTEEQLLHHPEGKWSSAQILEHLALAFRGTAKVFGRALSEGRPLGDVPTTKQRLRNLVVLDIGYLPGGRTAPVQVTPKAEMGGKEALELIRKNLLSMDRAHFECMQRFDSKQCIANHPVLGPLTLEQWPKFHWVHTRHHMKQIKRLRYSVPD